MVRRKPGGKCLVSFACFDGLLCFLVGLLRRKSICSVFLYLTMKVRRLVPVAFTFFRSSCVLLRHEPSGVLSFLGFLIGSFRHTPRRSFLVSFVFLVGFGSA